MATAENSRPTAPFTNGEVNRAGKLMLDLREHMLRDGVDRVLEQFDEEELDRAWEALTWWRHLHARPLTIVAANLRYHVEKGGGHVNGRIDVAQRLKRLPTMIDKLARESGRITQMHDIGGVRARLPSLAHVYAVRRRLLKSWTIIRERDYIDEPKPSGYRALHLIVRRKGCPIEVQLRTIRQGAWANAVEEDSRRLGVGLKFGAGEADIHSYYIAVSEVFAAMDRGEPLPQELMTTVNERYAMIKDQLGE
jgi:putative GTP pyrophosphokinase